MAKGKSDLSRAFSEDGARKTHVGGQALIEGIMMRGRYNWAVAVRTPDGSMYTEEHDLASGRKKNGWLHWPLVRGCTAMVESLMLGYKALEIATLHAYDEEGESYGSLLEAKASGEDVLCDGEASEGVGVGASGEGAGVSAGASGEAAGVGDTNDTANAADTAAADDTDGASDASGINGTDDTADTNTAGTDDTANAADTNTAGTADTAGTDDTANTADTNDALFGKREMAFSMILGLVLGIVLFIVAPAFLTNLIVGEYDDRTLLWNIVDGLLRVAVFVFYIWLIGRMKEIKRMFSYHGAEHKTIHCYEHGLPLTPENARSFPRLHVRCGTAFLIMVMIIAILVYTIVPINGLIDAWGVPDGAPKLALVIVSRIVLMPVIAGVSYEITVKWAGSHPENPLVKVVLWPGMQMQYLTTNEPDDEMLACAIAAMQLVLAREEAETG